LPNQATDLKANIRLFRTFGLYYHHTYADFKPVKRRKSKIVDRAVVMGGNEGEMKEIFEYTDYRLFLRDCYEHTKRSKPYFSFRFIASRVGINPGFIFRLMSGKVHLGLKKIAAFADLFELEGREREYFVELVRLGRAKRDEDIREFLKRLQSIRGIQFTTIADDQLEFFGKWHHMAMRSLLSIYPFDGKNYRRLGAMLIPPLSADVARESVNLLIRLGLVSCNRNGIFEVADTFISSTEKWSSAAIHAYQRTTIDLSVEALENLPKDERDISTVTFTCSKKQLETLRERLQEIRQEMLMLSQDCPDEDCVMQLNLQLFPAAKVKKADL
jgi:uncharacterized protein (TIGR02147 family)